MLGTTARQRNGSREVRPSLLTASNNNNNNNNNNRRSVGLKKYTHQWLLVAMDHKTRDGEQKHIAALQHKKRTESQGWLRRMEAHQVETHQHLSEVEKKKAMDLLLACKPHDSAIPLVAFAWGVNATTMRRIYKKMLQSPTSSVARKKRADAGNNLINSDAKRRSRFTQEFVFFEITPQRASRRDADKSTNYKCLGNGISINTRCLCHHCRGVDSAGTLPVE